MVAYPISVFSLVKAEKTVEAGRAFEKPSCIVNGVMIASA